MSITLFSSLANGQHLDFDLTVDVLRFDALSISAAEVRLTQSGANLALTTAGKTVWLDGVSPGLLSIENIEFADGSYLVFGDGTASTFHDAYGQQYTLESSTASNQVWGLGGADLVATGSGADWLVGNVALVPLNHVSRDGSTGSPVASSHASVSADGRYVAFDGDWTNFGATNGREGIIVKDMVTGGFTNEHQSAAGVQGGSGAGSAVISADGNVVAFLSASVGLVDGPSSGALYDIYASDPFGSEIVRVSTTSNGTLAADGRSLDPDLSGTGQFVVFESSASNFAAGGSTTYSDIFLKDLASGDLVRLSTSTTGGDGNGDSRYAKVSADGDYVVFQSAASNLVTGDTNGYIDIFLWSAATGTLVNVTKGITALANPNNHNLNPDVAYNGDDNAIVVFETGRILDAADTNGQTDVYAYNFKTNDVQLVSAKADGTGVGLSSGDASISDDGRWVVFTSFSDALVAGDNNGYADVFVKDLYTGRIALVSKNAAGVSGNGASGHAQISSGGDWIVFESSASNLATTDRVPNVTDVFRVANPLLADTLQGGAGNDTYVLARNDAVVEAAGQGIDTVQASVRYTLTANVENLILTGTANLAGTGNTLANTITGNAGSNVMDGAGGIDTVSYANASAAVTVSLALTAAQATGFGSDTLRNFENLTGSPFNDRLTGNTGANRLDGGAGSDTISGGDGNDSLIGGTGNDSLTGGLGADRLDGGASSDTLIGGAGGDTYVVDADSDVISELGTTAGEIDSVVSSVDWTLGGTLENLTLTGTTAVRCFGNGAANVLVGNAAGNRIEADWGNDTVNGGGGNDTILGGGGSDTVTGGTGADQFWLSSLNGSDRFTDFVSGTDKIVVRQSAIKIGDGDLIVEGAATRGAPGGFSSAAELVVFTASAASLTTSAAAAVIGSASSAYAVGRTALFVVDTGVQSGVFLFKAAGADALISASELTLLTTLNATPATVTTDYLFGT